MSNTSFTTDQCIDYLDEKIKQSNRIIVSLLHEDEPQNELSIKLIDAMKTEILKMESILLRINHYKRTIGQ